MLKIEILHKTMTGPAFWLPATVAIYYGAVEIHKRLGTSPLAITPRRNASSIGNR